MNDIKVFMSWTDAELELDNIREEYPDAHIEEAQYRYIILQHPVRCLCDNCPILRDDGNFRSHSQKQ